VAEGGRHKSFLYLYFSVGVFVVLPALLFQLLSMPEALLVAMKFSVLVLFGFNLFTTLFVQKMPLFHPYVMFLGMIGLFMLSRIAFDVFWGDDFAQTTQFAHYVFAQDIQLRLLMNVYLALLGLQIGAIISTSVDPIRQQEIQEDVDWKRVGLFLFYLGVPFLIYQYLMVGLEVLEKGYGARLRGEVVYRNTLLTTFMARTALVGFFVYLSGSPKGKWFYVHLIIFFLIFYLQLLEGARYYVMCASLVIVSLLFVIRQVKVRLLHSVLLISFLFVVSAFVGIYRSNDKTIERNWGREFVNQQGFALQIVGHAIEHKDDIDYRFIDMFAHTRYRIDQMRDRITHEGLVINKEKTMEDYNTLAFQLTYYVNNKALKGGWDMASSYWAEFFLLGREWLMFLGNILVGFLTVFVSNKGIRSKYGLLFLFFFLPSWLFIPRDNIFDFITDNMSNALFVGVILMFIFFIKRTHFLDNSFFKYLSNNRFTAK